MEIEDLTRRLRTNQFYLFEDRRSPSPEPIYDYYGKRMNTREVRKKQELEQRRHEKIQELLKLKPEYNPPADYRPPNIKLYGKVWIPQDKYPEINFVGLLIGPRGNSLKALEMETGTRIIVRGKGSVKEGKRRIGPLPGHNEPLHAYVTATTSANLKAASEKIKSILNSALDEQDANNSLFTNQLKELAVLNGTLKAGSASGVVHCSNCGSDQHKPYECLEGRNLNLNIVCISCGGVGHIAKDCIVPRIGYQAAQNEELDSEYNALLEEINGAPKPKKAATISSVAPNIFLPFRLPPQKGHPLQSTHQMQYHQRQEPPVYFFEQPPPRPPLFPRWMPMPPPPLQTFWPQYILPPPPPPPPE
uniref:Branchpoint-bridging protein n=1 Tax=Panagrolaimus sp. ES5 TaxID=591445 RepID=A0AC34FM12_9BILA